jgi:hypothetical protein
MRGPFGEVFELRSILDDDSAQGELEWVDGAVLYHHVQDLLSVGSNRALLRQIAMEEPVLAFGMGEAYSDERLGMLFAQCIASGTLRLVPVQHAEVRWRTRQDPVQMPTPPRPEPAPRERRDPEVKIRDWKLECRHHTTKGRNIIEKGTFIDVVPDKGETKDQVKVHWRDDYLGSMPPSLTVRTTGRPDAQASQAGGGGGFTAYGFDAEYLGDRNIFNILNPLFWRAYTAKTTYNVAPGPTAVTVNVYNPRQFKFEFKLPPMRGIKQGSKYEAQGGANVVRALSGKGVLKEKHTTEDAYWSPSSLTLKTTRTDSSPGPDFKPSESEQKIADTISITRDGAGIPDANLMGLKTIGKLLTYADRMRAIAEMVSDYAPKVGWYIDWNLQLMQGGLAVEWYWKEHTDHRVFQYIDFNLSLTIFSLTFEIGIGISACSFKLQLYASVSGELTVEAGAKRDSPDGAPGFTLPTLKGKITGALGARAEAGHVFQFNAKGETAIEAEAGIGINQGSRGMVTVDCRARWTGIKATCTFAAGAFGISYTKTESWTPIAAGPWWGLTWPEEQEYVPPSLSRDRIASIVEAVLYRGWNVRVFDASDNQVSNDRVAGMIADRIERDRAFDKTQKMVDGLANAIRQDLDVIGTRAWRRDYITIDQLNQYLGGGVSGRSIAPHLAAGASPTRQLLAANT